MTWPVDSAMDEARLRAPEERVQTLDHRLPTSLPRGLERACRAVARRPDDRALASVADAVVVGVGLVGVGDVRTVVQLVGNTVQVEVGEPADVPQERQRQVRTE